jgi:membrane protein
MARLQDFPRALRAAGPLRFILKVYRDVGDDNLFVLAAAVAYAWLLALFPFLIFILTLLAHVPLTSKNQARDQIAAAVDKIMAHDASQTIMTNLDQLMNQPRTGLLSIGIVVTIWIASGGMSMTMSALDAAYDAHDVRPFFVQRPLAILLTAVVTLLVLLVILLIPIGAAISNWLSSQHILPDALIWKLTFARYLLAALLMFLILAILYKFGTNVRQRFSFLSPGAAFTVLVWFVLAFVIRAYINRFGHYQQTYGTLGGVAILLLVFYADALVLLIGAEINYQIENILKTNSRTKS